mmetsp:Transcript_5585/g.17626  ORF Transcript_5585/g.17626 Transcript_5585/m.17626 type:complete len:231 (-) Transcript_5585:137-829(-)
MPRSLAVRPRSSMKSEWAWTLVRTRVMRSLALERVALATTTSTGSGTSRAPPLKRRILPSVSRSSTALALTVTTNWPSTSFSSYARSSSSVTDRCGADQPSSSSSSSSAMPPSALSRFLAYAVLEASRVTPAAASSRDSRTGAVATSSCGRGGAIAVPSKDADSSAGCDSSSDCELSTLSSGITGGLSWSFSDTPRGRQSRTHTSSSSSSSSTSASSSAGDGLSTTSTTV